MYHGQIISISNQLILDIVRINVYLINNEVRGLIGLINNHIILSIYMYVL